MAAFSFFDNREPPNLPATPGSNFGSFGNMSCFSFGQPKSTTATNDSKIFSFGFNPIKPSEANFDIKMEELRQSLSSINSQPLSVSVTKNISMSDRSKRISNLENTLTEIQDLKDKVCSVERSIAKLLMEELDSMKEKVSGCINPYNNRLQIVEQKSVSTSPSQSFGSHQPTLFPFSSSQNPPLKSKPKLFSNFKPKPQDAALVFNGASAPVEITSSAPADNTALATANRVASHSGVATTTTSVAEIDGNSADM